MAYIPPRIHDTGKAYPGAGEGFQAKSNKPGGPHTGSSAGFGPMPKLGPPDQQSSQVERLDTKMTRPETTVRRVKAKTSSTASVGHGKRK